MVLDPIVSAPLPRTPWLGPLPARILDVNIPSCGLFAAVSAFSAATMAMIARVTIPELMKRRYDERLVIDRLAGSATLGLLIPPSHWCC